MKSSNPEEPWKTQHEVMRERLQILNEKLIEKNHELDKAYTDLKEKEGKFSRTVEELNTLSERYVRLQERYIALEERLRQKDAELTQRDRRAARKKATAIFTAILIDVLFLLATIFTSVGVNMITLIPPNQIGYAIIGLALVTYIVAATIAVLRTVEGSTQ